MVGSEFLWPGRFHERLHISTRQYARIVRDWVTSIGLEPRREIWCCHPLVNDYQVCGQEQELPLFGAMR
jgi:hypothetical protein